MRRRTIASGVAIGFERAVSRDFALRPFAAGSLVVERFETLQPVGARTTRTYAIVELGLGVSLYQAFALRLGIPVPVGRGDGYRAPYTMRTWTASIVWGR